MPCRYHPDSDRVNGHGAAGRNDRKILIDQEIRTERKKQESVTDVALFFLLEYLNAFIRYTNEMTKIYKNTNKKTGFFYLARVAESGKIIDFTKSAVL